MWQSSPNCVSKNFGFPVLFVVLFYACVVVAVFGVRLSKFLKLGKSGGSRDYDLVLLYVFVTTSICFTILKQAL